MVLAVAAQHAAHLWLDIGGFIVGHYVAAVVHDVVAVGCATGTANGVGTVASVDDAGQDVCEGGCGDDKRGGYQRLLQLLQVG